MPDKTIGQTATMFGVTPSALRLWELQGMVTPSLTPGGHRRYSPAEISGLEYRLAQAQAQREASRARRAQ
jgi:DNA-binding transcriptional MerR regulator